MQTIELNITGMNCAACANHVTTALKSVSGVQTAHVDLASAQATVTGESLEIDSLVEAIEAEGYGAILTAR